MTLDFDGSVVSTKSRRTEGTAIGYNKNKGQRSYYPLLATVAQTGQVFDVLHRAGNVHDSNGAVGFVRECIDSLRASGFRGILEMRMDGAHFSEDSMAQLCRCGVEFSVSVPFARFPDAKARVLAREDWNIIDDEWSYFDMDWTPKSWDRRLRCVVYRRKIRVPRRGPIQLDLFEPIDRSYEFKVVMTNKKVSAKTLLAFHNGRGAQEAIFAQLKSQGSFDYIPTRREIGNRVFGLSCILAHNLGREMQMAAGAPQRRTATPTRAALWAFKCMRTIRMSVIQRAGRLTRPKGAWTLTMAGNDKLQQDFTRLLAPWGRRRAA